MEHIDQDINKTIEDSKSRSARAKKISRLDGSDLEEQINALQRAFAEERGENHRFREEMLALHRQRF